MEVERSSSKELRLFARTPPIPWLVFTEALEQHYTPDLNERASIDFDLEPFILASFSTSHVTVNLQLWLDWAAVFADKENKLN